MPRKLTFEELDSRLLLTVDALSAQSVSGNEASQIYIIQFEEPAIGELRASSLVTGAIATAPTTGSKLQHLGPFADTFREQVVNQHRQFVAQAERQLEHQLIVTHEYVAALNGIAVQVTPELCRSDYSPPHNLLSAQDNRFVAHHRFHVHAM